MFVRFMIKNLFLSLFLATSSFSMKYEKDRCHASNPSMTQACFLTFSAGLGMQAYHNLFYEKERLEEPTFFTNFIINGVEIFVSYIAADLLSLIGHWVGDIVHDKKIKTFPLNIFVDDHHEDPQDVIRKSDAENLVSYYGAGNVLLLPVTLFFSPSLGKEIFTYTILLTANSQKFHQWSHEDRTKLPWPVKKLQDYGVILSNKEHKIHHYGDPEKNIKPFESNFGVMAGWWNPPINWLVKTAKKYSPFFQNVHEA